MITRALEDNEIKAIFENVSGTNAKRNETLLITGIGLALRASELVGLKVSDVYDKKVKSYVTIRPETAKFGKERTIRIGEGIQDTIADNASIGRVILGSPISAVYGVDLRTVGVVTRKNGEVVETAAGAAVLGNPAESVAWLVNKLAEYNVALEKGELVISGSLIAPINIGEGDTIQADFGSGLGSVTTCFSR